MNKSELIAAVAASTEMSKVDAAKACDALLETIQATLAGGDSVVIAGFGAFEVRKRAARQGRNPQTGAVLEIAASTTPAFKPGKAFRDRV